MTINARPLARIIATFGLVMAAIHGGPLQPPAFAQDNLVQYGTSGMDRGQAGQARLQAQQATMQNNLQNIAACGNSGRLYGPAFSGPRSGNCPSALTLQSGGGVAIAGGAAISGNSNIAGTLAVTGNTTVAGTLASTGLVSANAGLNVTNGWLNIGGNYGVLFNTHGGGWHMSDSTWIRAYGNKSIYSPQNIRAQNQFQIGASVFGPPPSCNVNTQKLHWNNGWSCQTLIGGTGAGEQDPKVGTLTNNNWCRASGGQVQCNIAPAPACNATTQKLRWTGSAWECVTDNAWTQLSGIPVTASRWPAWSEVGSRPAHTNVAPPVCAANQALRWTGSAWQCVGSGSAEAGTLCGLFSHSSEVGGLVAACAGRNPSSSCPTGYIRRTLNIWGGATGQSFSTCVKQ